MKSSSSTAVLTVFAGLGFALLASAEESIPTGLTSTEWSNIRGAHEAWRHRFAERDDGTWSATNPGQQWRTVFDGRGFLAEPKGQTWQWGLELKSYGVGDERKVVTGKAMISSTEQRLRYQWDPLLEEWFHNDGRGLEQGWTLNERPAGAEDAILRLDLAVRGELRPVVDAGGQSVNFVGKDGVTAVTYGGLKAWDATGRVLPTRFLSRAKGIAVEVDDRGGVTYPVTIDPVAQQQAYLKASNSQAEDSFGNSVAVSGDTVVVGAHGEDSSTTGVNSVPDELAPFSGAAYVFTRSGAAWSQQAYLKASDTFRGDAFGVAVAISGDTLVVGASGARSLPGGSTASAGAAYVFTRSGSTWSQQAYLVSSNIGAGNGFGISVAVSGDTVVAGAPGAASDSGAAYVFTRSGSTWSEQAFLQASNAGAGDKFGFDVSVSGDTVVVGAREEDSDTAGVNSVPNNSAFGAGAAYVFTRSGSTWSQQAYLKASNPGINHYFGYAVGVSGDTVVVGAPFENSSSAGVNSVPDELLADAGAAYIFTRSGVTWSQQAYLKASNPDSDDGFGGSVAISGDTVVTGASGEDSSTTGVNSVPNELTSNAGAAYLFVRIGTTWIQQAFLKASNSGENDYFGSLSSVGVSGDTVVVGARAEDSSSTGVNSSPNDSASEAGAAYVFDISASRQNLTTVPDLTVASDTGDSDSDNLTRQNMPTFSGVATADAAVEVSSDLTGGIIGSGVANASGDWSVTAAVALADGLHQISADANGGSESAALAVTIDTAAPTVTVEQAGSQADPAAGAPIDFDVVFSETVSGFDSGDLSLAGTAGPSSPAVMDGPASYTATVGAVTGEGTVTVSIGAGAATDAAGNTSLASTSTDNEVSIDHHGGTAGTATAVDVSGGNGSESGWLEPGDVDAFTFTLTEAKHVQILTTGSTNTFGSLRNAAGDPLNDPDADDDLGADTNFQIDQPLAPGTYTVEVGGYLDNATGAYQLEIAVGASASLQPDNEVGRSAGATVGDGIYGTAAGQSKSLISKKARTVRGVSTIENDGEVPDDFTVRGTSGNRLFKVIYRSPAGNVTAAVVSGTYATGAMAPGGPAHVVSVIIKPKKKKILKKVNRRGKRMLIVKKKQITLALESRSKTDGTSTDTGFIKVQTK